MRIALYQPDIAQNTGTILRLCACLGIAADIVEPTGFPNSDRAFRRAGMDYLDQVELTRHASWSAFLRWRADRASPLPRLIVFSTRAATSYLDHRFEPDDILLFGREFGRAAGRGAWCGGRPPRHPDAPGIALAQRRDRRRDRGRRGAAADRRVRIWQIVHMLIIYGNA